MSVAQDDGAITLHEVDVALAFDILDERTLTACDHVWFSADGAERANRRVHSAGDHPSRAFEQRVIRRNASTDARGRGAAFGDATLRVAIRNRAGRHCARSANHRAKYVRMMSAPARLTAVNCSIATPSWSIQPFADAALIIAYSPLTWYAATGRFTRDRT